MASIASHGGPIKTNPASVHWRANVEFSLNLKVFQTCFTNTKGPITYKAIAGMDGRATMLLGRLNDLLAIEILRRIPQVDRKG